MRLVRKRFAISPVNFTNIEQLIIGVFKCRAFCWNLQKFDSWIYNCFVFCDIVISAPVGQTNLQ